jgi:hypothetical protein
MYWSHNSGPQTKVFSFISECIILSEEKFSKVQNSKEFLSNKYKVKREVILFTSKPSRFSNYHRPFNRKTKEK